MTLINAIGISHAVDAPWKTVYQIEHLFPPNMNILKFHLKYIPCIWVRNSKRVDEGRMTTISQFIYNSKIMTS